MIAFNQGVYVRIEQDDAGPQPLPLKNGFSARFAYLILGGFTMSESAEMFLCLPNDRNELWFISNRQVRLYTVEPDSRLPRIERKGAL